jgi:hypothetical protein
MVLSENQAATLLGLFDNINETCAVDWIVRSLRKPSHGGYQHPERIVRDALDEGIVYVDAVDEDGKTYLGLTKEGEAKWLDYYTEG